MADDRAVSHIRKHSIAYAMRSLQKAVLEMFSSKTRLISRQQSQTKPFLAITVCLFGKEKRSRMENVLPSLLSEHFLYFNFRVSASTIYHEQKRVKMLKDMETDW